MYSRQFTQYIFGLVFLFSSSFALGNADYNYVLNDSGIEILELEQASNCQNGPIPDEIDGHTVYRIGSGAFFQIEYCQFKLPTTITSVGEAAFFMTPTVMSLPESLKEIQEAAFYMSYMMTGNVNGELILPASIESIGKASFGSNNLSEVHFLGNRPDIHQEAFIENNIGTISYCSGAFGWPGDPINGVTPIENSTCGNNTEFDYTIEYPTVSIDGCSFFCTGDIIIPESIDGMNVTKIASNAFDFSMINSVIFPNTIEMMGGFIESTASTLHFLGDRPSNLGAYFGDGYSLESVTYCPNTEGWPGYAINGITPEISEDCDNSNVQQDSPQYATFDIDQNGSVGALSDGLILLRYFFGLRGEGLIANVLAEDATRTSAADIEAYIESHMP